MGSGATPSTLTTFSKVAMPISEPSAQWYAVQTRPRHEKKIAVELDRMGIINYVPLITETHLWSDRRKAVEVPLFPGYAFVHTSLSPQARVSVLRVWGVLNFVGPQQRGTPILDSEIDSIRVLLRNRLQPRPYPFLKVGQRVVVRGGSLDGLEGIFAGHNGSKYLVVSVGAIQRSVVISAEGYDVRPV